MTLVQLVAGDFDESVPLLLQGTSVVALVPATDLRGWAAEMAWQVARAAAGGGRRTALIDCFVDAPSLHTIAGAVNDAGLVDAFDYGVSFNRIVQQQPQASLFFIPAGTFKADAKPLMENPRWKRLSAGFRHEDALLLLYVGAEYLAGLAAEPDGLVVLAPQGLDLSVADATPALTEAVGRGMTVLAVVADEEAVAKAGNAGRRAANSASFLLREKPETRAKVFEEPVAEPVFELVGETPEPPAEPPRHAEPPRRSAPRRRASAPMAMLIAENQPPNWGLRIGIVAGLAAAAAIGWYAMTRAGGTAALPSAPPPSAASVTSDSSPPRPSAPLSPSSPPAESLPWTIQVASMPTLNAAFSLSDSLEAHGTAAIISPVHLRGREAFYRVHAGPFPTPARADSALRALHRAGMIDAGAGSTVSTPLSVALGSGMTREAALAERRRLRLAGVPVFVLGAGDGTFGLYAGAYDASAQATLIQDLLTSTGGAGALGPRAGYVP